MTSLLASTDTRLKMVATCGYSDIWLHVMTFGYMRLWLLNRFVFNQLLFKIKTLTFNREKP